MSDDFELTYEFDPYDASDALLDSDGDGVDNVTEERNQTNPLVDDYGPELTLPDPINLKSKQTFTQLTLEELLALTDISADDGKDGINCCEVIPVGFENGSATFKSGSHIITWRAEDKAGNIGTITQVINFAPIVSFAKQQIVAEGTTVKVNVELSGESPKYPLEIPFSISGTVDSFDYRLSESKVVITSGFSGEVDIDIRSDNQSEGEEELILTFNSSVNSGDSSQHTIFIQEGNIAPLMDITISQLGTPVSSISKDNGEVSIELSINDANYEDSHIISWDIPDYLKAEISANQLTVYLIPSEIELPEEDKNLISFSVLITDSGEGELSLRRFIDIPLFEQQPRLDDTDTDLDGIPDNVEGFSDDDGDGLPAFLDNSSISYMQPLHVNANQNKLIETEPGLRLVLGKFAKLQFSDGIQLSKQEIADTGLIAEDSLTHSEDYFDFAIEEIVPVGRSIFITIPLIQPIPEHAVYRKFSKENGWQDFVEDANNSIASSALVDGVCPIAGNETYTAGLTANHVCLRLIIEDGGANDADGVANGRIVDPGVIAVISNKEVAKGTDPEKSSSGGATPLMMIFFFWVTLLLQLNRRKKYTRSS